MSDINEDLWLDLDLAESNVNRAGTVLGSTIAVFTFLLFFLYPRYSSGQIDPIPRGRSTLFLGADRPYSLPDYSDNCSADHSFVQLMHPVLLPDRRIENGQSREAYKY